MKVALAQHNPTVGDVAGNLALLQNLAREAKVRGADLVVFTEQAILGYPAKDLLLRREVIAQNLAALETLAKQSDEIAMLVGFAEPNPDSFGRPLYNAVALLDAGQRVATVRKRLLPTYDVFDEARYFEPAGPQPIVHWRGRKLGISICEDLLSESLLGRPLYDIDPIANLARDGADLFINTAASPFWLGKTRWRIDRLAKACRTHSLPGVLVNQVGGNDELIFDGGSCAVDAGGRHVGQARAFANDLLLVDLDRLGESRFEPVLDDIHALREALVIGVRDYVRKCGFSTVVLGLSGGIDSAITAAIAVAALGPENVTGVAMPSRFSSDHSVGDAAALAENLGIKLQTIPIQEVHSAYEQTLAPNFTGRAPDVTEENIQARIRGAILMALSNKFGALLLTTGNKSEIAVGYCTLYGDMCGGLAVISDVPKSMVYRLARHINEHAGRVLIPENTITKPPSAELRPDQHDQQSLPAYDILDDLLERYEEDLETPADLVAAGHPPQLVDDVLAKIHMSEYKRQQMAPGLKVTSRAFGFGRRMPIAARVPRLAE